MTTKHDPVALACRRARIPLPPVTSHYLNTRPALAGLDLLFAKANLEVWADGSPCDRLTFAEYDQWDHVIITDNILYRIFNTT